MYRLVLLAKVQKQLDLAPDSVRARILVKLQAIQLDPFQGKKLEGQLKGIYSVRVVPFRILYEIRKHELVILVVKIGDRKDVYR